MAAVSATAATAAAPGSAAGVKLCFNSCCKQSLEKPQKGWRRRTGEFAELCDSCASAYNDGKFCTTFHMNASGWRCCESCGKQIHCGCIVSFHMFVLLDAGGIECITCARRSFIVTPNPAWPPPSLFLPLLPERIKDLSGKNWSPMAGSGPVPWHQAPSLFAGPITQSHQLKALMPIDYDVSGGLDRLRLSEKLATSGSDNRKKELPFGGLAIGGNLRISSSEASGKGNSGTISEEQSTLSLNACKHSVVPGTSDFNLAMSPVSRYGTNDFPKMPRSYAERPTQSLSTEKTPSTQNSATSSETMVRNGKAKGDVKVRSQLLPRYWPRISDEELQQISGDSNSVITPLFEKMLSASDAGRIGRLVLPKKCAEAYFPPISNPEGVPLEVQDMKGKEWVFHFRFWPNNNSRMYVLEGITQCIQSMQLQAGDVVTFSRIEPEGKLVMGCRKVSTASSDQGDGGSNGTNEHSASGDVKSGDSVSIKKKPKRSPSLQLPTQLPPLAPRPENAWSENAWSEVAKPGPTGQEILEPQLPFSTKRRKSSLGLKSKRLRIESEETLELKVTWEQVQGLFRPPANTTPNVFIIDGCEIEEYEDPPVIGRPTFPAADFRGKRFQWVQCERCYKWRKVPADAYLKARWTCTGNLWDPHRSACSAAQELPIDMLEDLLPTTGTAASKRMKGLEQDPKTVEALDGLDALADLALQENIVQNRTKHPRHKLGCSCIVCIQPPSGKGPKHKPSCQCMVCKSMQRRVNTIMMKKERKQVENDSETGNQILQQANGNSDVGSSDRYKNSDEVVSGEEGPLDNLGEEGPLQFKGEIDLNTQPDKEEDSSPKYPAKLCAWKKRSATQTGMEEGQSPNFVPQVFPLDKEISETPRSAGSRGSHSGGTGGWSHFLKRHG